MTSRRIEELTAKLTEWQLVFGFIDPNEALDDCATKLATLRAAREQAEKRAEYAAISCERLQSERDTARAAREQAEEMRNHWCNEYANSQNQLATAAEQRDTALEEKEHYRCESERFSKDLNQVMFDLERNKKLKLEAASDRDTALARVKELEALQSCATDQEIEDAELRAELEERCSAAEAALASAQAYAVSCSRNSQEDSARREAAESDLASARKLLERADRYIEQQPHDYGAGLRRDIRALLWCKATVEADMCGKKCGHGSECLLLRGHEGGHDTQHGCMFYDAAPVAAPSLEQGLIGALLRLLDRYEGCPAEDYADAWWTARSLLRGHREQLALAGTAPVAAPCAGCASARELLRTADDTPQDLLTSAWRMLVRAWLKEHP